MRKRDWIRKWNATLAGLRLLRKQEVLKSGEGDSLNCSLGSNARYRGSGGRILQKEGDWFEAGTKPLNQSEKGERGKPTIAERWALAKAGEYEQLPPENLKIYKYIHAMYRPVEDRDV